MCQLRHVPATIKLPPCRRSLCVAVPIATLGGCWNCHTGRCWCQVAPPAGRLEAAVARVADFLNRATKPVLVAGAHMRSARARAAMVALAEASGGCL